MPGSHTIPADLAAYHQRALLEARELRRAARADGHVRERAARAFVAYVEDEVLPRCREEERTLFPLMVAHHAPGNAVSLTLAEHEWLHVLLRRLRDALAAGAPEPEALETVALLLARHVTRETVELMPFVRGAAAA